jgi:hypothetical protein
MRIWPFAGAFATRLGGFEPPTRGLEVDARGIVVARENWAGRTVERSRFGPARPLWHLVVDPALTHSGAGLSYEEAARTLEIPLGTV